ESYYELTSTVIDAEMDLRGSGRKSLLRRKDFTASESYDHLITYTRKAKVEGIAFDGNSRNNFITSGGVDYYYAGYSDPEGVRISGADLSFDASENEINGIEVYGCFFLDSVSGGVSVTGGLEVNELPDP